MRSHLAVKRFLAFGCCLLWVDALYACSPTLRAGSPEASIDRQLTSGAAIYTQTCATSTCHGTTGEGIRSGSGFSAWPLVGPEFQARHPTGQVIFDVVRSGDEASLRALTDQQIYDVVAYELSRNHVALATPLTAANADSTFGGKMAGPGTEGFFPPFGDFELGGAAAHAALPLHAQTATLRLQIDELAEARRIAGIQPPAGGAFLMLVFVLTDVGNSPIAVGPENMSLTTESDGALRPESINPHVAIERFHDQTIQPEHGTAAVVIFRLPDPNQFQQLVYSDPRGNRAVLNLKP